MTDMDVSSISNELAKKERKWLEEYIIEFFGDEETARAMAHRYTLESSSTALMDEKYKLTMKTTMRIRLKTTEELNKEKN